MVVCTQFARRLKLADMTISHPDLLALDFDGVLCDGLQEYFQVPRVHPTKMVQLGK